MTINLISTERSPHHLQVEWDVIQGIIAQFAHFESNKLELTTGLFQNRLPDLAAELVRVETYVKEFRDEMSPLVDQLKNKLPSDDSLKRYLGHVAKEGVLNFSELNKVALLVECASFLGNELGQGKIPELQHLAQVDYRPFERKVLREFRHLVDESGELFLERHPELAELNRRLRETEERIRRTIQEWINEPKNQKTLQYHSYDVHYDRFVVPVRTDSYRSELGLIVSRSDSGQTLFVEPFEVREACNRRIELIAKIDEIITQLARKFSLSFKEFEEFLNDLHQQFLSFDFYLAKATFAQRYDLQRPHFRDKPGFTLNGLFHPLIQGAVKNSVDCKSSHHGIVISGPNTGGKTVFLKSIALSYLLFYHGHFVPALEAEMFPYEGLFYFGNDLQDIRTGLSSFSGEVKNYLDLLENILPSNLILIDEIFNSTSSDEASALSLAYFEELHQRADCHIVVSTHHQMFKTLVHQDRHYLSCHVGFDMKNMRPTYKIQWGTPGSSMAIDIFRILSRHQESVKNIPDRALARLNTKNVSYETLLQRVSQKQIELDQLLTSTRKLEVELKNQKGAMEGVLNLKIQEELTRARKELEQIMNEARHIVDQARRQEIQKVRKIDERTHDLRSKINALRGDAPEEPSQVMASNLTIDQLSIGDSVYSLLMKKEFSVQAIDPRKKEVTIAKGAIKLTVPVHTLTASKRAPLRPNVNVSFERPADTQLDYDVRGMRLSEFQNLIQKGLGHLLSGDVPYLQVIHGHGDGILKNWLRDYLKRSKDFKGEIPENGNDGETKITLK